MTNHFSCLGLPPTFDLDTAELQQRYHALMRLVHPDRFSNATAQEQLHASLKASAANDAYTVLKNPASRAAHLLALRGIDALDERNTNMPATFLMQQLEWREALAESPDNVTMIVSEIQQVIKQLINSLRISLDVNPDLDQALASARQLIFLQKLITDIGRTV